MKKHRKKKMTAAALVAVPVGAGVGALICTVLLLIFSFVFVKLGSIPDNAVIVTAWVTGALASFAAGWFSVKLCGSKGLLIGALSGALLFLLIFIGSICCGTEVSLPALLAKLALFTSCGASGGVIKVNKKIKIPKYN